MIPTPQPTTDATIAADLKVTLLKSDLEDRGICEHRAAERMARLCLSLTEPDTLDAAIWKGAERLYQFMDGRSEALPLIARDNSVRALYVTMAVQSFASVRLALEGNYNVAQLATALGDFEQHKQQLAKRRPAFGVVDGGRYAS